jgi:hypothetical protein
MMAPPKKPPTESIKFRFPKAWHAVLEKEKNESGTSKAHIIRGLIYNHIKMRLAPKKP